MKKILLFIWFLAVALSQFVPAQIPQTISYQGVLTGTDGSPVTNGTFSLTFKLYNDASKGDTLWQETQDVEVSKGVFSVILGSKTPLNLPFDEQYWLGITISGGAELSPRVPLSSSPYSLNSHSTIAETEPGQGLTIRNAGGETTHKLDPNGDAIHTGKGTFLGGIVAGDTTIHPDTSFVDTLAVNQKIASFKRISEIGKGQVFRTDEWGYGALGLGDLAGLKGVCTEGSGVLGISYVGYGVSGESQKGYGVSGFSNSSFGVSGTSNESVGVWGNSEHIGVEGLSTGGIGVHGISVNSRGVFGESQNGIGVRGESTAGDGVIGQSSDAAGVFGTSSTGAGIVGSGMLGGWFQNKVKVDEVPTAPNQERFLVWDNDNVIKYRSLPSDGSSFDGTLQDKELIVKNADVELFHLGRDGHLVLKNENNAELFGIDPDGSSFHNGLESFNKGIDGSNNDPNNKGGVIKAGNFNGSSNQILRKKSFTLNQINAAKLNGIIPNSVTTANDPVIWGYTERTDGAAVLGQSNDASNTYPATWGVNFGGGAGVVGEVRNTSSNYPGVWALEYGIGTALLVDHQGSSGDIFIGRSGGSNQVRIDKSGKGFFNGGTQSGGADVAEAFEVENGLVNNYEPGDVLAVSINNDRCVDKSDQAYSTLVIGVYATKPGVLLTERKIDDKYSDTVPVGVIGVIPTKVTIENGPIHRGDLLVASSKPGYAMKGTDKDKMFGATIGKALEDFSGSIPGKIKVLVNVK
jgi:hypothetical protein